MAQGVRMLIITGMSGAGKTVAVQCLEDLGFFCVDNLPPVLIFKFSELVRQSDGTIKRVALVCDPRGGEFFETLFEALEELDEQSSVEYQILYLEADDETLVRRYKASRRRHPMAPEHGRIVEGIARERDMLQEVRARANIVVNTSRLKPAELKEILAKRYGASGRGDELTVNLLSFGFKYGLPIDADLVFDVRFLPNPYYVEKLRPHTGQDPDVYEYVMQWPATQEFMKKLLEMIDFLLPQYSKEGKSQIVVGIGCTGGRHRSVAIAERLREHLQKSHTVMVSHRDLGKESER
ncbi:MAG: RNase adapter RapZ [Acidibacillus sp.]|uniref:Nucleotide-binding protein YvcJ n=1 Tax=Sulfoacidibacillus ferrooxidans TaxID=2005001 RepID=A0A9X1V743_9BACL|nr:RNase adapter RapZ [Sulfoacidibacillus ferrooxidans]MCI0182751.1 Nucleotide-binding protein YvcJ [Sulfoacidibacillus ferrooxidans]MCY0892540.1 RNase adapter RapZ [Acidibacillus sp.]